MIAVMYLGLLFFGGSFFVCAWVCKSSILEGIFNLPMLIFVCSMPTFVCRTCKRTLGKRKVPLIVKWGSCLEKSLSTNAAVLLLPAEQRAPLELHQPMTSSSLTWMGARRQRHHLVSSMSKKVLQTNRKVVSLSALLGCRFSQQIPKPGFILCPTNPFAAVERCVCVCVCVCVYVCVSY